MRPSQYITQQKIMSLHYISEASSISIYCQEETEMRKQRSDHCKYKYLMLRNGIKVDQATNLWPCGKPVDPAGAAG